MIRPLFAISLLAVALAGAVAGCKKSSSSNPFGTAHIATVDNAQGGRLLHYQLGYDSNNNIDSIVETGSGSAAGTSNVYRFAYFGSSYSITDKTGVSFTVDANTDGTILKVLTPDTVIMTYNGGELTELDVKSPATAPPYYTTASITYTWANGDAVAAVVPGGSTLTYDYDVSKSGQPGDAFRINELLNYGRPYLRTTHIVSDVRNGNDTIEKFVYQFDGSGRVTQYARVIFNAGASNDTVVNNYTYY